MFWIPYASIFVFVVTLVISMILGYKRGWRSALFISIVFLALNGVVIGVCAALYKSMLWDLYKTYFMKDEMKIDSINYDLLSSYYKLRVILVFAGLVSPITYALTYGVYAILKKPLNNYLMPRVKEISSNEKELVYRKNPKPARIIGATISGTTALFAASYFASAANVLATPRENQNGFNKFNDALGRIYNFGIAGNTEETKMMSQFLRNVDGKFVSDVQSLITYDAQKVQFDISKLSELEKELGQYKFLFESEEATRAIFAAVVANVSAARFDVMDFGFTTSSDKDGNDIAVATSNRKVDQLKTWVQANNLAPVNLTPDSMSLPIFARQALLSRLIGGLSNWEATPFALQLAQAKANVETCLKTIEQLKQDLATNKSNLDKEVRNQSDLVNEIKTYAGFDGTIENTTNNNVTLEDGTNPKHSNVVTVADHNVSVTRSGEQNSALNVGVKVTDNTITTDAKTGSTISNGISSENTLWKSYVSLNDEYIRLRDESAAETAKFNAIDADKNALNNIVNTAQQALNDAIYQINLKASNISSLQTSKNGNDRELARQQARETELDKKDGLVERKNNEYQSAETALANARTELSNAVSDASSKQSDYVSQQAEQQRIQGLVTTQNSSIAAKQAEVNTANSDLTKLVADRNKQTSGSPEWDATNALVLAKQAELSTLNTDLKALQDQLKTLNDQLAAQNAKVNSAKTALDTANSIVSSKTTAKNNAENTRNRIQSELQQLQQESSNLKTSISNLKNTIAQQEADLSRLGTEKTNLEQKRDSQLIPALNDAKTKLDNFMNAQSSITGPSGTTHEYGWTKASAINKQKIDAMNAAQQKAQTALDAFKKQRDIVNGNVNKVNGDLNNLSSSNTLIRNINENIDTLLNYNRSLAFNSTTDNADWTKADDHSIYYAEQKLEYWKNKVAQRQIISDNVYVEYNKLKAELIATFNDYAIPGGR